jgi:hypothetical protein
MRSETAEVIPVVFGKGERYLIGSFPNRQTELNQYDLIILYDIDISKLKSKQPLMDSFLSDRGGGMFVILGENYLKAGPHRWLDNFLPFTNVRDNTRPMFYKFNGEPVESELFHPIVRLADSRREIRQIWRNLPYFEMLIPIDSIGPEAKILITTGADESNPGLPILGYRRYGAGKVLTAASAPFWPWAFFGYGFGEDAHEYELFVDGLVNWLALKEESDPIRVAPDKNIYTRGEKVGFNASVYDLGFRPIVGASGSIVLKADNSTDSTIIQLVETGDGKYRAEIDVLQPGIYNYTGMVQKDGRKLKESAGQIAVESFTVEEFRRRPDFSTLASISQSTGGIFTAVDNADSILNHLNAERIRIERTYEIVIWNKFWLLGLFIIALGIEWFLRKKWQLV